MTALVGSVHIIPDDYSYMNVDVIHKVVGVAAERVRLRAVPVQLQIGDTVHIQVMHPLHVLKSRLYNFYWLTEKRNAHGVMQMRLAAKVAYHYILEVAQSMEGGQRIARKMIEEVVRLAKGAPGRVAKLHGVNFRDIIPFAAIQAPLFQSERLPRLLRELDSAQPPATWKQVPYVEDGR